MIRIDLLDTPFETLVDEFKVIANHAREMRNTEVLVPGDIHTLQLYQKKLQALQKQHKLLLKVLTRQLNKQVI